MNPFRPHTQPYKVKVSIIISFTSPVKRHREVKYFAQDHTANEQEDWNLTHES